MIRRMMLAFVLISSSVAAAQEARPVEALDGLDPVLLVQGKEVFGKAELAVVRGGFEYKFSSADTRAAFERAPERYEIQLGGLCAKMGGTATGNPSDYVVHDGRIFIFGSDDCHKKFVAAPAKYLAPPPPPMPASHDALRKGRALVEKAVAAIGGAERLDSLRTYVETARQTQPRGTEEVVVTSRTMWKFPGGARMERSMTVQGRQLGNASVLSNTGAWFVGPQGAFPVNPAARPSLEQEFGREIVPLLRARTSPSFAAAALGTTTIDGVAAESVRVRHGAVDVTLALEAASGKVLRATFADRNAEGAHGESVILYSDYRPASGLLLPFSRHALFDGTPNPFRTRMIDAISTDETLDDALFAPALAARR